ncbi:MAG TPA: hypothetical protein VF812_16095 [Ktedonobacterales bacterium]
MYSQLRLLLTALTDERAYERRLRPAWFVTGAGLALFGAFCVWCAYSVLGAWWLLLYSDAFGVGAIAFGLSMLAPFLALARIPLDIAKIGRLYSTQPFALMLALKRAVEAGNANVAPHATVQPVAGREDDANAAPDVGPLVVAVPERLVKPRAVAILLYILGGLLFIVVGLGVTLAPNIFGQPLQRLIDTPSGLLYLGGCGVAALGASIALMAGRRAARHRAVELRGLSVEIGGLGLSFRQPAWAPRTVSILWAEARAFAQITYKDTLVRDHTIYVLWSDTQTLLWEEPPTERYAPEDDKRRIAARQLSAQRLAEVAGKRTHLALLDLTETLNVLTSDMDRTAEPTFLDNAYQAAVAEGDVEVATALWRATNLGARRRPRALRRLAAIPPHGASEPANEAEETSIRPSRWRAQISIHRAALERNHQTRLQLARALLPYYPSLDAPATSPRFRSYLRAERRRQRINRFTGWAYLFLFVTMFGAMAIFWLSEGSVTSSLERLPAQVTVQAPHYYASFAQPQAGWEVHAPTKDDPASKAFVRGAYELTASDIPQMSSIPFDARGDFAIMVNVAISTHSPQDAYDTAGLMFDVTHGGASFTTFTIDRQGDWTLARFNATGASDDLTGYMDSGTSDAISTADGATNTLLLIRHGALYLLYVNGKLVDRYLDRRHVSPRSGAVGVFSDGGDITARFTEFAIYPIPAQLAAVPIPSTLPAWLT